MTSDLPANPPIRLALIGAGIFARDAHLPALDALGSTFEVVAVCSRTEASAASLAALLSGRPDVYRDLNKVLARDDIDAVDVLVPIDVMPAVAETVLASGKHVISEKPLAPNVATGRRLLEVHQQNPHQVWMVAENWRYESVFVEAAKLLESGIIGKPLLCSWTDHFYASPANKYYHTSWRQAGAFSGGYLLDGGIHRVAVLRMLLGEFSGVSAVVAQVRPDLPPADTLHTVLWFENGVTGSYSFTVAMQAPWPASLYIAGETGSIEVNRFALRIIRNGKISDIPVARPSAWFSIQAEFADFAAAIHEKRAFRNTPQQGLQDVAVVEAMLTSAHTGQRVTPERFV